MLRGKKHLLLLIAAANVVLVAGILYATVSTITLNLNIDDWGGNPALASGSAEHKFSAGSHPYHYSYATTVRHNGAFVADDYHAGSGTGPGTPTYTSYASGTATAVSTSHNTTGSHVSYIVNDNTPSDEATSSKSSSTSRSQD